MAEYARCTWYGGSGTAYSYYIHSLPVTFSPGQDGNYIYSRKNDRDNGCRFTSAKETLPTG